MKRLYIVHTGINPESVGFNIEYLKAIPWLIKCKILREENGRPHVDISVINENEFNIFCGILTETKQEMFQSDKIKNVFSEL